MVILSITFFVERRRFVHSVLSYLLFGIPNRLALDLVFVLAEKFLELSSIMLEISLIMLALYMLNAFHPLLCLKLCWHNQLKPSLHM